MICFRAQLIGVKAYLNILSVQVEGTWEAQRGLEWLGWLLAVDKVVSMESKIAGKISIGQSHHKVDWVMARCG